VDELNKYAPSDGPDTYVRAMLLDIAERGRYLGLVLFAARKSDASVGYDYASAYAPTQPTARPLWGAAARPVQPVG